MEGQYGAGAAYSGWALSGIGLTLALDSNPIEAFSFSAINETEERKRFVVLGSLMQLHSGFLSSYHSFRSAVRSRGDEFDFLKVEETPLQLLAAPFKFTFLRRRTTAIPLMLPLLVLSLAETTIGDEFSLTGSELFLAGAFSMHAGVAEEAAFRGWLMPLLYHSTDSKFWSNTLTAAIFAAGHIPSAKIPIGQFLTGWYWGWLTQRNQWSLSESIFIHFWWDALLLITAFAINEDLAVGNGIRINLLQLHF